MFRLERLSLGSETAVVHWLPTTWVRSSENKIQFLVQKTTEEYQPTSANFQSSIKSNGKKLSRIERIQNERWCVQHRAHFQDFTTRLKQNTERRLYYGCAQKADDAIIKNCFDRGFTGKNAMHSLYRTLFICAILASLLFIHVTKAGAILAALEHETVDKENCGPAGAVCGNDPPCCNPRCRVNWSGAWCT
ncbi:unnamed protein product [Rotaria socialis]|uniref:Uncharacterized protein n=1 Tax=Rotaria socialis TaxID=392032 RepID=A0A818B3H0_9BILA|nr:unnamed protein product [Rotaria socialis]CAF4509255.1 unnamed protein product [Rotaria socialis]